MFKKIISGFSKFFTKDRVIILVIFLVLAWALYSYSGSKTMIYDGMNDGSSTTPAVAKAPPAAPAATQAPPPSPPHRYIQKKGCKSPCPEGGT